AIRWATPDLDALGLEQAFQEAGISLTAVGTEQLQDEEALTTLLASADLGLSGSDFAVAETGSLVLLAEEGKGRLITLLPTYHIALLTPDRLVPTFQDLVTLLRLLPRSPSGRTLRSAITFVTGPSKSGDIELHLTKGVHGPKEFHVIVVKP
ncbi:MAG: lactate utilization protein, partial [Candidatus Tectomicrobia bacterium]|nr:lactate utilization protein [Candidatus Tectomicrobia bacterium]